MRFKLGMTTPYDYLLVMDILPKTKKLTEAVENAINFCLSLSETKNASAE